jgi:predicted PurR-regulated permease PerM
MSSNNFKVTNPFQLGLLGGLGVLTAILIGAMVTTLATVITYVFAALFIALGLEPVVSAIEKRGLKRPIAILIVIAFFVSAITTIVLLVLPEITKQASNFKTDLPTLLAGISNLDFVRSLDSQFDGAISNAINSAVSVLESSENWPALFGGVVQVGIALVNGFTGALMVFILSLYFMASVNSFKLWLYKLVPNSRREKFKDIADDIFDSVGRYVIGQVTIAALNASWALILLLIFQIPFAGVLAFIAFILAMIPLVGSLTAVALVSLIALTQSPTSAAIIAIAYLAYIQIDAYVISPRIMSKAVAVPGVIVVISALAGGALLGILGALVAIPVAASIITILNKVWVPHQQKH